MVESLLEERPRRLPLLAALLPSPKVAEHQRQVVMQVRQAACRQDVLPIQRRSSQPERIHIEGRLRSQRILILAATLDGVVGTGQPNALIRGAQQVGDRKSTRLNSSHSQISYAV